MTPRTALLAAAFSLSGLALAGCGHQMDLQRPGADGQLADPNMQQSQSAGARARADTTGADPEAPQSAREVRTYEETPVAPVRAAPIQGSGSDPFAAPPQGAIPDPYNHPERPGT